MTFRRVSLRNTCATIFVLMLELLGNGAAHAAKNEHRDVIYAQGYVAPTAESTEYQKKDLLLDALLPSGDGPHPALVVVHGGSFQNGDKANKRLSELMEDLVKDGYACFSINYRMTGDNPPAQAPWNLTLLQRAIHASFVDTKAAVRYVRANAAQYKVNPDRIAVLGESAGAFSALGVGMGDATDYVNDGTELPPLDSNNLSTSATVRAVVDLWGNAELIRNKFNPGDPPVLIVHGKSDVHIGTFYVAALNIEALCKANNIPVTLHGIEGFGHGCFDAKINGKPLATAIAAWLDEYLK